MRVGVLTTSLPSGTTGGAEVQAKTVAMLLARQHDVSVITRSPPPEEAAEVGSRYRVLRRCRVGTKGFRFVADIVGTLITIGQRRQSLDVLLAYQTVIDGLLAVLAKILFRIPVVVSVRSEREYAFERVRMIRWFGPFVFKHADTVIVQTRTIEDELICALNKAGHERLGAAVARKIEIIPNGISVRDDQTVQGDNILYVGRLIEAKGVRHLVDAMRECPGERLVIVGSGPESSRLKQAAGGASNVVFAGRVPHAQLESYYRRTKLLVMPSLRDEGMPNAIMEAMTRGIPVVATRNAGIPDLVRDGETGLLVGPGDSEAIARSIRTIASDDKLRERLSRNSLREIRRYDWPNVVAAMTRELEKLVAS